MSAQFVMIDRETPMLLPPDLRDWIPEQSMVESLDQLLLLKGNRRGGLV